MALVRIVTVGVGVLHRDSAVRGPAGAGVPIEPSSTFLGSWFSRPTRPTERETASSPSSTATPESLSSVSMLEPLDEDGGSLLRADVGTFHRSGPFLDDARERPVPGFPSIGARRCSNRTPYSGLMRAGVR